MYNFILNPNTGKWCNINGTLGLNILKNYLNKFKEGGGICPSCHKWTKKDKESIKKYKSKGFNNNKSQQKVCNNIGNIWTKGKGPRNIDGDCCKCWCCKQKSAPIKIKTSTKTTPPKTKPPKLIVTQGDIYQTGWLNNESCTYKINLNKHKHFCSFDFDNTLVELHSSKPKPNVVNTLKDIAKTCNIVVFSNQKGIIKNHTTHDEVKKNMDDFSKKSGVPISFFYSTNDDAYRKPMGDMFKLAKKLFGSESLFNYYCGDAAGRSNPKDFSISDLYFANNIGITFKIPEEIFHDQTCDNLASRKIKKLYQDDIWTNGLLQNPRNIIPIIDVPDISINLDNRTLILMVGPQGSGKSTIAAKIASKYNFGIINADRLKTKTKMNREFNRFKKDRSIPGIIIDNTNPTKKVRNEWISKVSDWKIIIIYFDILKEVSFHLTRYRMFFGGPKMPAIAIHIYYKKLEPPTFLEGQVIQLKGAVSKQSINHNLRFVWR